MAKRVVLHIGAMKSGTSYLQNVLDRNRAVLKQHDLLFAGEKWRQQVMAARELSERGAPDQEPITPDGPWQQLVDIIDDWHGTALVSMEFFGPRGPRKIELVRETFAGADLQVVLTARDLARSLPAMWVESTQNRGTTTWEDFLDGVRRHDLEERASRNFWRHQAIADMAQRWSEGVGRDHFTLITIPPRGSDPTILWDRFSQVAGIPAGTCDLAATRSNPQLDAASAMVLRRLNEVLARDGFEMGAYDRVVKAVLAKRGLVQRAKDHPALAVDERWVRKAARAEVDRLRAMDLRVLGDLDDLLAQPVPGVEGKRVRPEDELAAAVDALTVLVRRAMVRPLPGDTEIVIE